MGYVLVARFKGLHFALLAFNLEQQVGESPDFPHVGILHSAHQQSIGMGGSDFRGEFEGRGTRQRLLQQGLALRLASLRLPGEDIPQELASPLPCLPVLGRNLGVPVILFRILTLFTLGRSIGFYLALRPDYQVLSRRAEHMPPAILFLLIRRWTGSC